MSIFVIGMMTYVYIQYLFHIRSLQISFSTKFFFNTPKTKPYSIFGDFPIIENRLVYIIYFY